MYCRGGNARVSSGAQLVRDGKTGPTDGVGHGGEDLGVLFPEVGGVLGKVLVGDFGLSGRVGRVLLEQVVLLPSLLSLGLERDQQVALGRVLRGRRGGRSSQWRERGGG